MNIIQPIIAEIMELHNTAPAARSFAFLINKFFSLVTASAKDSNALFRSSIEITIAKQRRITNHSATEIFNTNPKQTTRINIAK